jgi:hypothetical protein
MVSPPANYITKHVWPDSAGCSHKEKDKTFFMRFLYSAGKLSPVKQLRYRGFLTWKYRGLPLRFSMTEAQSPSIALDGVPPKCSRE